MDNPSKGLFQQGTSLRRKLSTVALALVLALAGGALCACTAASNAARIDFGSWSLFEDSLSAPGYSSSSHNYSNTAGTAGTSLQIDGLRDYYVDASKAKTATVLVYMCGSDLETYSAAASSDIREMLDADLGPNVKVVIQTGGAMRWHFTNMAKARQQQRWLIDDEGMFYLEDVGSGTLLDKQSLTDFITWGVKEYPADRYMLVFWDHGGGTIGGFGSDEVYSNADSLSLLDLREAIQESGTKFDMIGFDACLMGTIETAYALEPVADYLIASEEYELGDGWEWSGWLTALGKNPSISTLDLGKVVIDDFTKYYFRQRQGEITLSLVDLREVPYVYERMGDFLAAAEQTIASDNSRFSEMSAARKRARAFADGGADQVDLIDLINRTQFPGRDELAAAVSSCVKYRSGTTINGANGLAVYFPYSEVRDYSYTRSVLNNMGFSKPTEFYDYFLSVMGGSPISSASGSSGGLVSQDSGAYENAGSAEHAAAPSSNTYADQSYSVEEWFEQLLGSSFNYEPIPDQLSFNYDGGGYVVPMSDEMWNAFSSFHITVMEEANGGYLMLGRDDVYDQDEDGNIVVFYNNEWLTMGGQAVSFFSSEPTEEANGEYSHSGYIPALLNGEQTIEINVYWPVGSEQGDVYTGYVQGYRLKDSSGSSTYGRGLMPFQRGDVVTPLFDYYDSRGNYVETIHGSDITINTASDLEVTYELFDHNTVHFWGTMITIYGDQVDTPVISQ